jgi:hypothetical protein
MQRKNKSGGIRVVACRVVVDAQMVIDMISSSIVTDIFLVIVRSNEWQRHIKQSTQTNESPTHPPPQTQQQPSPQKEIIGEPPLILWIGLVLLVLLLIVFLLLR